jgi:hypothetical protein
MSNEIRVESTLRLTKGEIKNREMKNTNIQIDQTGTGYNSLEQTIGTTPEALDMGDLTTPGRYECKVTGDNNIQIGAMQSGAFVPVDELWPGEPGSGRWATTAPHAKAIGGTSKLEHMTTEE